MLGRVKGTPVSKFTVTNTSVTKGEFLQLFVHQGTQQLALTMLFLVTLLFVTVNFENGVS